MGLGGCCGGSYASHLRCGAHVPLAGGSEFDQALKMDRKQAYQGEISCAKLPHGPSDVSGVTLWVARQ